jgi:hypothetical protein
MHVRPTTSEASMADLIFLALTALFFAVASLTVTAVERL